ncbi:MAG: UV DNA damage repair endonuclease UvsE [Bacteroidota bacterium]
MRIRLGYVAMALRLQDCSPSKTVTLKNLSKIPDYQDQVGRLARIARENLANTLRILKANYYDGIMFYRFTSRLIPLCTHPQFLGWNYRAELAEEFKAIGDFVTEHGMRVGLHPDHFTLLNSPNPEVQKSSRRDLNYHLNMLEAMGLGVTSKLVIHVGGKYEDRNKSLERFKEQFKALPDKVRERLILENDDRCFTAAEVLKLAKEIGVPMVLDIHHHQILNNGEELRTMLPEIFATWGHEIPKVHLSSPRSEKDPRSHADYIATDTAVEFINLAREINRDFDIMLEAKQKDLALLKLVEELKELGFKLPTNVEIII